MRLFKLILLLSLLTRCNSVIPGNFWLDLKRDNITDKFSDHGPYGGTTIVHWELPSGAFEEHDLLKFAEDHNWTFKVRNSELEFPFEAGHAELSKYIKPEQIILTFSTNWILVEPETDQSFDALGYIFMNPERTKVTVFQRWGE